MLALQLAHYTSLVHDPGPSRKRLFWLCPSRRLFAGLRTIRRAALWKAVAVVEVSCGVSRRATLRWLDAQYVESLSG